MEEDKLERKDRKNRTRKAVKENDSRQNVRWNWQDQTHSVLKKIAEGCDEHTKIIPYSIILVWSEYEFELGEETKSVP